MKNTEGFRCPFDVRAEREGKILHVTLGEDRTERMSFIKHALERLHTDLQLAGVKFRLPDSLQGGATSNKDLYPKLIPFQCEMVALDMEFLLNPCLPYQLDKGVALKLKGPSYPNSQLFAASAFAEAYASENGGNPPHSAMEIADWLTRCMQEAHARGVKRPTTYINGPTSMRVGKSMLRLTDVQLLEIHLSHVVLYWERLGDTGDPLMNRNLFSIVTTPFYLKRMGRYSDDIEIVYTREADFNALSQPQRTAIRRAANIALQEEGIRIKDVNTDNQNSGLWIPSGLNHKHVGRR